MNYKKDLSPQALEEVRKGPSEQAKRLVLALFKRTSVKRMVIIESKEPPENDVIRDPEDGSIVQRKLWRDVSKVAHGELKWRCDGQWVPLSYRESAPWLDEDNKEIQSRKEVEDNEVSQSQLSESDVC